MGTLKIKCVVTVKKTVFAVEGSVVVHMYWLIHINKINEKSLLVSWRANALT